MADIRIDRYEFNPLGTSGTFTISNVGNWDSAFIRFVTSSRQCSGGQVNSTSNLGPDDVGIRLQAGSNTTTINWNKQLTNQVKIMFEVWVYTGSAGGAYEFIVRDRVSGTISGTSDTEAISGIVNREDCIPLLTGWTTSENSNSDHEQATFAVHLNSSNQIEISRNNSGTTTLWNGTLVEFTGAAWSIGCGRSANHDTGNQHFSGGEIVTMNTDPDGVSGSTFDVTDWSTAMIVQGTMEGDTAETGLSDTLISVLPATGTTQLRFTLDNGNSRNDGVAYAYVLQCDDLVVNRSNASSISENNGGISNYGTNLDAPAGYSYSTPLNEMSLEWFPGTNGEGTAHIRGHLIAQIIDTGSAYQVQHWIHRQGNDVTASWGFVDLSALVDSGGGTDVTVNLGVQNFALSVNSMTVSVTSSVTVALGVAPFVLGLNPIASSTGQSTTASLAVLSYSLGVNTINVSTGAEVSLNRIEYVLGLNTIAVSITGGVSVVLSKQTYALGLNSLYIGAGVGVTLNKIGYNTSPHPITTSLGEGVTIGLSGQNYVIDLKQIQAFYGASFELGSTNYLLGQHPLTVTAVSIFPHIKEIVSKIVREINIVSKIQKEVNIVSFVRTERQLIGESTKEIELIGPITKEIGLISEIIDT